MPKPDATAFDGVLLDQWHWRGDTLERTTTQPGQDRIKRANQELRKNAGALGNLTFGGLELNIPELDYVALVKKYPDLQCTDALTRTLAWKKFMGSAESDPYRVRDRRRARAISSP